MRVVDDDDLLVAVVDVAVEPEQVLAVELEECRRPGRVEHRDEPLRPVAAGRPGDDPACLVGMVAARVRDDLVDEVLADPKHPPSLVNGREAQRRIALSSISCTPVSQSYAAISGLRGSSGVRPRRQVPWSSSTFSLTPSTSRTSLSPCTQTSAVSSS